MSGRKIISKNRKGRFNYEIEDTVDAGLVLTGTEIKSVREGKVNLQDSYALIRDGEAWVMNMHIAPYEQGNRFNVDTRRTRKLLLHKGEINRLYGKVQQKGLTLVPLSIFLQNGYAKLEKVTLVDRLGQMSSAALDPATLSVIEPMPSLLGKIRLGSVTGYPGEVVKVPVVADEGIAGVKGISFRIPLGESDKEDHPYLDFEEMTSPGTIWPEFGSIVGSSRREMDASLSNYDSPGKGPGSFVVLHMKIPEGTPPQKSYPLNLEDLRFVVGDEEERTGAFENGAIRVLCRRERGHVRRPGHSEEPVTVEDALLTLRALVGMGELTGEQQWAADMDGDSAVTVGDAVGILKVAVGLELPRCEE